MPVVATLVLALAIAFAALRAQVNWRKARLIEDIPTAKIRSCAQGFAELMGTATRCDDQFVVAPLSGQRCLWFKYTIEERAKQGGTGWKVVKRGHSEHEFSLQDETGECAIYPAGADMRIHKRDRWYGESRQPNHQYPLAAHLISDARYRYTEWRIEENAFIYVLGQFQTKHTTVKQQTDWAMADIIREWKQDYPALLRQFDADNNGELDLQEWETVRQTAKATALAALQAKANSNGLNAMVAPPSPLPFIIATKDPKQLCRHYRWRVLAWLALAVACIGGIAYFGSD